MTKLEIYLQQQREIAKKQDEEISRYRFLLAHKKLGYECGFLHAQTSVRNY